MTVFQAHHRNGEMVQKDFADSLPYHIWDDIANTLINEGAVKVCVFIKDNDMAEKIWDAYVCSKCGTTHSKKTKFCTECGNSMADVKMPPAQNPGMEHNDDAT